MSAIQATAASSSGSPEDQEQAIISQCADELHKLAQEHAEWFALYDVTDVDSCRRAELVELMSTAPTPFAQGVIYGKYAMRLTIEAITGRSFN